MRIHNMPYHIVTGKRHFTLKSQLDYESCHGWFDKNAFEYPLVDHAQLFTISCGGKKTKLMVAYGYYNERSCDQLQKLQHFLIDKDKRGHFRSIYTLAKEEEDFRGRPSSSEMIKLMMSTETLDESTWKKIAAFSFDDRYDVKQILGSQPSL